MKILTLISAVCTLKPMHFFILFPTPHIPLFTYYLRGCIDLNQQSGTTSCENVCLQALPKITPARPHVPSKNNLFRYNSLWVLQRNQQFMNWYTRPNRVISFTPFTILQSLGTDKARRSIIGPECLIQG